MDTRKLDHKIQHLGGEFRRNFGPWGARIKTNQSSKVQRTEGGGGGWLPRGGMLRLRIDRRINFNQYKGLKPVLRIVKNILSA